MKSSKLGSMVVAIQFFDAMSVDEMMTAFGEEFNRQIHFKFPVEELVLDSYPNVTLFPSDWVIRLSNGNLCPCKNDLFEALKEVFDQSIKYTSPPPDTAPEMQPVDFSTGSSLPPEPSDFQAEDEPNSTVGSALKGNPTHHKKSKRK